MLKDDISPLIMQNHLNFLTAAHESDTLLADDAFSGLKHVYDGLIKGYAGSFTDNVVEQIRRMPEVAYVERDQIMHTVDVQKGAPWVSHFHVF